MILLFCIFKSLIGTYVTYIIYRWCAGKNLIYLSAHKLHLINYLHELISPVFDIHKYIQSYIDFIFFGIESDMLDVVTMCFYTQMSTFESRIPRILTTYKVVIISSQTMVGLSN